MHSVSVIPFIWPQVIVMVFLYTYNTHVFCFILIHRTNYLKVNNTANYSTSEAWIYSFNYSTTCFKTIYAAKTFAIPSKRDQWDGILWACPNSQKACVLELSLLQSWKPGPKGESHGSGQRIHWWNRNWEKFTRLTKCPRVLFPLLNNILNSLTMHNSSFFPDRIKN